MTKLSNTEARELFRNSTSGKGSKIRVDPGVLEKVIGKPVAKDYPAPKVSGPIVGDKQPEVAKRNKYGAKPVKDPEGGNPFPSTFEFNNATDLRNMVRSGEIVSVGRQVLVLVAEGVTWQIDFVVHHNDGTVEYIESKGKDTADFLIKEKLFRAKYPSFKLSIQRKRPRKTAKRGK